MKLKKQQVAIKFDMVIDDNGEMEYNTVKEVGRYYHKNGLDVIVYEEEIEDGMKIKNLITIQPDKVTIKRSGVITMNQQFLMNRKAESLYQHPHGKIHMETYTHSIVYNSMMETDQGKLSISYQVKLNGLEERKHKLTLTYKKEEMK